MGLSTKQVSNDGPDWGESLLQNGNLNDHQPKLSRRLTQNQQPDPLPCPRCNSKNTKFCYYNNYNKSQPRHFCKACKRHWTKGGTLRNVPVGGGRKNKRLKTSANNVINNTGNHRSETLSLALGDQKDIFGIPSQAVYNDKGNNVISNFSGPSSTLPLFQNDHQMPSFILSSFERNQSLNGDHDHHGNLLGFASSENEITTMPPTTSFMSQMTWQVPMASSGGMDVQNYWNWDDVMDPLVSTDQLNISWDDTHA